MHAVATVQIKEQTRRFFCDQATKLCSLLDSSQPAHSEAAMTDDGSYRWEYVETCPPAETTPCILLRACPSGSVMINSTGAGSFDSALQECSPCGFGFYVVDPLTGPCQKCPEGARCPDGARFEPKTNNSKWVVQDGLLRLIECPPAFALIRRQQSPQSDHCLECPGYSLYPAVWPDDRSATVLQDYCQPCPEPSGSASCDGLNKVSSLPGWYLAKEKVSPKDSRREPAALQRWRTYRCDPGVCLGNNECSNGRTGVVCGGCPENHVLNVGACQPCANYTPDAILMWRLIFSLVFGSIIAGAWFMLCWAPVFGMSSEQLFKRWFGWPLRIFKRLRKLSKKSKKLADKKQQVDS